MRLIVDSFGIRYAVERKMYRDTVIYYVLALEANGNLALRARTSKDLRAGVPAFIARAVLSLKRQSINEVIVWPDHRRRGIASAMYRVIEAGPRRTAAAEQVNSRVCRSKSLEQPPPLPVCLAPGSRLAPVPALAQPIRGVAALAHHVPVPRPPAAALGRLRRVRITAGQLKHSN